MTTAAFEGYSAINFAVVPKGTGTFAAE